MYNQEYEVNFPLSVDSMVRSGIVNASRIWICPLDDSGGWGTLCATNWQKEQTDPQIITEKPMAKTSYSYQRYYTTDELIEKDISSGGTALFVCQQHGKAKYDYRNPAQFGASEMVYTGKVLRLWSDGSVNIKQINTEPDATGTSQLSYSDLFGNTP